MNEGPDLDGLQAAPLEPRGLQRILPLAPHQLVDRVTPQRDLFTIAHLGTARVDVESWGLSIGGLVGRPCKLTFDDIRSPPKREVQSFHQCAGFPKRSDIATRRIANVVWGGADLGELVKELGIRPEARFMWAYGLDRGKYDNVDGGYYQKDMPLERLAQGGVLLAYEANGEPLTAEHGFPVRLIIPGYYGTNDVKWLGRLVFADRRAGGIYTTAFYNDPVPLAEGGARGSTRPLWEAPPESIIVSPQAAARLNRTAVDIWGWAWSARGIARVDVSTDNGESWSAAQLDARSQWSWQRFQFRWVPKACGPFNLIARAADVDGAVQPMMPARNSVQIVAVEISDGSADI